MHGRPNNLASIRPAADAAAGHQRAYTLHCIHALPLFVVCFFAGCWEKIEFQETEQVATAKPTVAEPIAPPVETTEQRPEPEPALTTVEPHDQPETVPATPVVGERYAAASNESAPIQEKSAAEPPVGDADQAEIAPEADQIAPAPPEVHVTEPEVVNSADTTDELPSHAIATADPPPSTNPAPTAATAPAEAPRPVPAVSIQRAAWRLGSNMSIAALANDRGIAAEQVPKWFAEAQMMAGILGVEIAPLPEHPAGAPATGAPNAVKYLSAQLTAARAELNTRHGPEVAALFDLALRSNLLLMYNAPGSAGVTQIADSIGTVAPRTGLPAELWQPLLDTLDNGAPEATVRLAVRKMHADVDSHLAAAAEQ